MFVDDFETRCCEVIVDLENLRACQKAKSLYLVEGHTASKLCFEICQGYIFMAKKGRMFIKPLLNAANILEEEKVQLSQEQKLITPSVQLR